MDPRIHASIIVDGDVAKAMVLAPFSKADAVLPKSEDGKSVSVRLQLRRISVID